MKKFWEAVLSMLFVAALLCVVWIASEPRSGRQETTSQAIAGTKLTVVKTDTQWSTPDEMWDEHEYVVVNAKGDTLSRAGGMINPYANALGVVSFPSKGVYDCRTDSFTRILPLAELAKVKITPLHKIGVLIEVTNDNSPEFYIYNLETREIIKK